MMLPVLLLLCIKLQTLSILPKIFSACRHHRAPHRRQSRIFKLVLQTSSSLRSFWATIIIASRFLLISVVYQYRPFSQCQILRAVAHEIEIFASLTASVMLIIYLYIYLCSDERCSAQQSVVVEAQSSLTRQQI
jgi:hypothetical protein